MNKFALSSTLALALGQVAYASDVAVVGTIPTVVESNAPHSLVANGPKPKPNFVLLQKVKLSPKAQHAMHARLAQIKQPKSKANFALKDSYPENVDLGMNGTPVLNQGMHGSCVTFASSGALDALLGQGDYVSQLCSLTLGNYLEAHDSSGEYPSGWEGSWGPIVLKQFFKYGVVSMDNQQAKGCGGLNDYPVWDPSKTGKPMSPKKYAKLSESISDKFEWQSMLSVEDAFHGNYDAEAVVNEVKQELNSGNRVTFGVLLDVNYGSNGAVGSYKSRKDTWMLTPAIEKDAENNAIEAGHEMIITGYDDNAVVRAADGTENKGLFILRNSWGSFAGDHGNYYMTYDHFKLLALEAQALKAKA